MSTIDLLIKMAMDARANAHAPYSNHPVGAAILTETGGKYAGCNVENAAYPLGACAEANAIGAMIVDDPTARIVAVIVAGPAEHLCSPCGGCRQRIREFGDDKTDIIICDRAGTILLETTLGALLPHSFGPDNIRRPQQSIGRDD